MSLISLRSAMLWLLTGMTLLTGLAQSAVADAIAYAELSNTAFGIQNLNTGTFTQLGSNGGLVGLGETGGQLYGAFHNTLYAVNPATGALTSVGTGTTTFGIFGSTTAGLFGLDYSMNLYSVNPTTGASTLVGATGLLPPYHNGLSSGSDTLYLAEEPNPSTGPANLYSLNTLTGAATFLGGNATTSAVFGPVFENGQLYAASCGTGNSICGFNPSPQAIYTLDRTNGSATFVTLSAATQIPDGMAPVLPALSTSPEPSSIALVAAAAGLIGLAVWRQRNTARI